MAIMIAAQINLNHNPGRRASTLPKRGAEAMQILSDILCGLLTALTAAAFAQFGVTLKAQDAHQSKAEPEVHRTVKTQAKTAPKPYVEVARRERPTAPAKGA
jgi:hypothetical protein